jgi:hypothetical protein
MSGGDSLFFVRGGGVRDLQPLRGGAIAMLAQRSLHIFDATGRPFSVTGGISSGVGLRVDAHLPQVTVRDAGAQQWKTYDLDGKLLAYLPIEEPQTSATLPMRDGAALVVASPALTRTAEPFRARTAFTRTVSIQSAAGVRTNLFEIRVDSVYFKAGVDTVDYRTRSLPANQLFALVPTRFGASGAWAVDGDSLVVFADGVSGDVTWYSIKGTGATISMRGHVGRVARPVVRDDVREETARLQRMAVLASPASYKTPKHVSAPSLLAPADVWSVATRAFFADNGDLWIGVNRVYTESDQDSQQVFRVGDDNTWTVFPRTGRSFLITLPPRFSLTAIRQGKLYGYTDTPAGVTAEVYVVGKVVK